jgi:hypothetical protein
MRLFTILLLLASLKAQAQSHAQPQIDLPELNTSINGIDIGGLEYWPFIDNKPHPYPSGVVWSHEEAAEKNMTAAMECMVKASKRLTSWLRDTDSPVYGKLKELKRRGGPSQFFMWTNDYTKGPQLAQNGMRPARVWHWCSDPADYESTPDCGWLKFESTVGPDGACKMPEEVQVASFLQQKIDSLPLQPVGAESAINEFNGGRGDQSTDRVDSPSTTPGAGAAGTR